ncbi:MAG: DsrE family protein [Dehalococcoidales bacterium]|nr:DsrE family protein [Dehalococcoidales bacterium]
MDVVAEQLGGDFEVKFLPVYACKEADELGVDVAPAIAVNRRIIKEGVPTKEEILDLIERARPIKLGIVLTKTPFGSEDAENALEAGRQALLAGDAASLFLLSDGVWLAKRGKADPLESKLADFIEMGGEVAVSGEHLKAAGLGPDLLVGKVIVAEDGLGSLVDLAMDDWDKAIIF